MPKNNLSDLNNHLFAALERLNDEDLPEEKISSEVQRATAIMGIADKIIANAKVTVDALKLVAHGDLELKQLPESLQLKQLQ